MTAPSGALLVWTVGTLLVRAHPHLYGSAQLDSRRAVDYRFSPLLLPSGLLPVISAGEDDRTAAAETIFHTLPPGAAGGSGRPARVWLDRYRTWQWSTIRPLRDLQLLRLDRAGLRTLGLQGRVVDMDASGYPASRRTAIESLTAHPEVDGLVWNSRQLLPLPSSRDLVAGSRCVLLVGLVQRRTGGVGPDDFESDDPAIPFMSAEGVERLDAIAAGLDVTVVRG